MEVRDPKSRFGTETAINDRIIHNDVLRRERQSSARNLELSIDLSGEPTPTEGEDKQFVDRWSGYAGVLHVQTLCTFIFRGPVPRDAVTGAGFHPLAI